MYMPATETRTKRSVHVKLTGTVHHWPTLKTVLMVEKALKEADGPISLEALKRALAKKIMDQTLRLILAYLEDRGSILIGPKGIAWIENKNSKFLKFIERNKLIEV